MRNFYWNVFAVTGSIDAYLMYKGVDEDLDNSTDEDREEQETEEVH